MKHFLLFYEAGPDYLELRPAFRGEHLQRAWDAAGRGELVVAGAYADPIDGAVLMFAGNDKSVAEEFARTDPVVAEKAVHAMRVFIPRTVVMKRDCPAKIAREEERRRQARRPRADDDAVVGLILER